LVYIRSIIERSRTSARRTAKITRKLGVALSDYALAELERIAERPAVSDVLRRAGSRAGGAASADIVAAVRSGRDRE